jgi:hypothetical protein
VSRIIDIQSGAAIYQQVIMHSNAVDCHQFQLHRIYLHEIKNKYSNKLRISQTNKVMIIYFA